MPPFGGVRFYSPSQLLASKAARSFCSQPHSWGRTWIRSRRSLSGLLWLFGLVSGVLAWLLITWIIIAVIPKMSTPNFYFFLISVADVISVIVIIIA